MSRMRSSINHQVGQIIKEHNGIGKSKMEYRAKSGIRSVENGYQKVSNYFHSYKSLDNVRSDLKNLGHYLKDNFGIKDMSKIDKDIVKSWIESKDITYRTASNYISELNKLSEHFSFTREDMKDLRTELKTELRPNELEHRAYEDLDKIQLSERCQPAFELQRDYGLRVSAATHIRVDKQLNGNTLKYQEKGGKWSEREISKELADKIREQAKDGTYHAPRNIYRNEIRESVQNTGQKWNGTHGIRHTYAQRELESGKSREEVSQDLGHVRVEITNTYLR